MGNTVFLDKTFKEVTSFSSVHIVGYEGIFGAILPNFPFSYPKVFLYVPTVSPTVGTMDNSRNPFQVRCVGSMPSRQPECQETVYPKDFRAKFK